MLWQHAPLLWVHPRISPAKTSHYPTAVAQLALMGIQQCLQYFGSEPASLIIPYSSQQFEVLTATVDDWAIVRCMFGGTIDNHYPKDPLLQLVKNIP